MLIAYEGALLGFPDSISNNQISNVPRCSDETFLNGNSVSSEYHNITKSTLTRVMWMLRDNWYYRAMRTSIYALGIYMQLINNAHYIVFQRNGTTYKPGLIFDQDPLNLLLYTYMYEKVHMYMWNSKIWELQLANTFKFIFYVSEVPPFHPLANNYNKIAFWSYYFTWINWYLGASNCLISVF